MLSDTFVRLRIKDADDQSLIKTSAEAYVRFLPPDEPPIIIGSELLNICLGESVTVVAESFFDQPEGQFGVGGKFNSAQIDGWRVDGLDGFFPASGNNNTQPTWKETNSNDNPNTLFSGINYDTSDNTKFAIAHAAEPNRTTTLETPVFNTIGMTSSDAIMTFYTAYYFCNGGYGTIELSFDAGVTYAETLTTVQKDKLTAGNTTGVHAYKGANCNNSQYPVADPFRFTSIDLGAHAGLAGLRVRFTFNSGPSGGTCNNVTFPKHSSNTCTQNQTFNVGSGWAIDDVGFNFAGVDDELEWTDENGNVIATGTTATITPVTPGVREYGVTTLIDGCRTDNNDGTNFININTSLAYAGENYKPLASNCGENSLKLNAYDNRITAVENFNKGAWKKNLFVVPDTAAGDTDYKGTGVTGEWSIIGTSSFTSCGSSATFSSSTDPNAIFNADPGDYKLRWTLINGCFDEIQVTIIDCQSVDFDGINDFVTFKDNYNLDSDFSIEIWIKPISVSDTRTIFSRKDAGNNATGYDLSIVNGQVKFNWYNGYDSGSVTSDTYKINTDRWYHLAVTFKDSTYKLYVDGIELGSASGSAPALTADNVEALLGAMYQASPSEPINYFNGWVEELKIWKKALSVENIRQMMNQRIREDGPNVLGVVLDTKIYGSDNDLNGIEDADDALVWGNLIGYYRMDIVCGDLTAYKGVSGRLRNITSGQEKTAPIPYTTRVSNQTWDTDNTWTNFNVWDVPNSLGINDEPIDWNIAVISHNINSGLRDITLLGLLSESGELTMDGVTDISTGTGSGQGLWITHYLKLNGVIDLQGESQLVQKRYGSYDADDNFTTTQFSESIFEENSSGYIERDQQGKQNSYNYNYWSSPVTLRGAANNAPYKIPNVLRDGTNPDTPININFVDGAYSADGPVQSPIKITSRWIWTYRSTQSGNDWDNYYKWFNVGYWGNIKVGDGFTMKGTGGAAPIDEWQNYVFVGKPNSGDIPTTVLNPGQLYLIGNPYPSALDADEFIKDNIQETINGKVGRNDVNVFNGALYFWDHFGLSNNHILAGYEGGYATYNLMGGVIGISNVPLSASTGKSGIKVPERYIPVGQGFFVGAILDPLLDTTTTTITGGNLYFKNSQRAFKREGFTGTNNGSLFMKTAASKKSKTQETDTDIDTRAKIRLQFDSPLGYRRPLLVGVDERTTNNFDIGFDAPLNEDNKEDMYWIFSGSKFVIQGVNNFDKKQELPLGLKIFKAGLASIKIDDSSNLNKKVSVYIKDKLTGLTYQINDNPFEINLEPGEYLDRFSMTFKSGKKNDHDDKDDDNDDDNDKHKENNADLLNIPGQFLVYMNNRTSELQITKPVDTEIETVNLYNYLGQLVKTWNTNLNDSAIYLPVNVSTGAYIVQINTQNGPVVQKVIME